jgi:hypothetical protein
MGKHYQRFTDLPIRGEPPGSALAGNLGVGKKNISTFDADLDPSLPRHKEVCGATSFLVLANEWKRGRKPGVAKNTVFSQGKTIL